MGGGQKRRDGQEKREIVAGVQVPPDRVAEREPPGRYGMHLNNCFSFSFLEPRPLRVVYRSRGFAPLHLEPRDEILARAEHAFAEELRYRKSRS